MQLDEVENFTVVEIEEVLGFDVNRANVQPSRPVYAWW
jgi:hypothetical protein